MGRGQEGCRFGHGLAIGVTEQQVGGGDQQEGDQGRAGDSPGENDRQRVQV